MSDVVGKPETSFLITKVYSSRLNGCRCYASTINPRLLQPKGAVWLIFMSCHVCVQGLNAEQCVCSVEPSLVDYVISTIIACAGIFEPLNEKTCLRSFRPGPTRTWLYRRYLEAWNFGFRK